jgi:TPR repeat protein
MIGTSYADFQDGLIAYEKGNYSNALKQWESSAYFGDTMAQYNIGVLYQNGEGVLKDHVKAMKWYRKSAYRGNSTAQLVIAKHKITKALDLKRSGIGLEIMEFGEARFWVEKLFNNKDDTNKVQAKELWNEHGLSNYSVPEYIKRWEEEELSLFNKAKSWFD